MEDIILQKAYQMVVRIQEKVLEERFSVEKSIPELMKITHETALDVYKVLVERADQMIREAKKERKTQGLVVERVGDTRKVVTSMGELTFSRSYYWNNKMGQFEYPIDHLMGIDGYERIDPGLSKKLVSCARTHSYRKSSKSECDGVLSAQTVMNKIRKSEPEKQLVEKRKVAVLHIDADEDHVALQHGKRKKSTEVPLVSVYEGIEKIGQRGVCKNIFHAAFVLDSYHKNKYVMVLTAGCSNDD